MNISNAMKKLNFGRVISVDYWNEPFVVLDLSRNNPELKNVNLADPDEFNNYIKSKLGFAKFAIGKYNEDRMIYDHSTIFHEGNDLLRRTIHLGIDLWVEPGTKVIAPFGGVIHSFQNNKAKGDYGPTIIIKHNSNLNFYTLFGHLSKESIKDLKVGEFIHKGSCIGWVGSYPENGDWPPHLHFQIITDMMGKEGDFPGVASMKDREKMLEICPDPNLILRIDKL